MITPGSSASSRASSTRCRPPPDSSATIDLGRLVGILNLSIRPRASAAMRPVHSHSGWLIDRFPYRLNARLSAIDIVPTKPRLSRSSGMYARAGVEQERRPEAGLMIPAATSASAVWPFPLMPATPTISCRRRTRSTLSSALTPRPSTVTELSVSSDSPAAPDCGSTL